MSCFSDTVIFIGASERSSSEKAQRMRASRLLSIMMVLQTRGRTSAEYLADELEVSVRTIYRDIDELSAAGVPVYAEKGRNGGFQLLDGWRTRLTGLTPPEAQALFLSGLPGPAADLGLGDAAAGAELKLLAALPADWQVEAQRVSSRFHLDAHGWFQTPFRSDFLKSIADAVWAEKRVAMSYQSWRGFSERVVSPMGLVLKSGGWYVVALNDRGEPRTFRIGQIKTLSVLEETFVRPADFDLAAFWTASTAQFERDVLVGEAHLKVTRRGRGRLMDISSAIRQVVEALPERFDDEGWMELCVPIEEYGWASREILRMGAEVQVLGPADLRQLVGDMVRTIAGFYAQ